MAVATANITPTAPAPKPMRADDRVERRRRYEQIASSLKLERASFDDHWRDLGTYIVPRRPRFTITDRNQGDRRNQKILDGTAGFSARTLASGLHAGLTSPARPWMKLSTPDPSLALFPPVKAWLHDVTNRMLAIFELSNLYQALPTLYGDFGVFGTSAMGVLEDPFDLFRAYTYPIGSYWVAVDRRGLVNTWLMEYVVTVDQLLGEFGRIDGGKDIDWSVFSKTVRNLYTEGRMQAPVEVCWLIEPNPDVNPDAVRSAEAMPYRSCHYEKGNDDPNRPVLREAGFRQFPIMVPRWGVTGNDSYGTDCPGMQALGDIRQLQTMTKRKGQAIEKMVNPPLAGPGHLRTQKVSTLPGDITYEDMREGQKGLRAIYDVKPDLREFNIDAQQCQYRIQRAFFEDLFLMLATGDPNRGDQPITAREVSERHEEKLLALGPVLERTNDELLDPMVDRVFSIMARYDLLPPTPDDLKGVELRVEYISLMAEAQKLVGVVAQDRFLQSIGQVAAIWPDVRHKVKAFKVVDTYSEMLGVDPGLVATDEEASQAQQAEAQAAQAAAAAQQVQQAGAGARDLSQAQMGADPADNALKRIVEGVTSAG